MVNARSYSHAPSSPSPTSTVSRSRLLADFNSLGELTVKALSIAPFGLWLAVAAAVVQLPAVAAEDSSLEEIVVTGTRIVRTDFSSASPIASVPAVAFTRRTSTTVETTLNQMPQLVPSHTSTSNEFGFGEATANLRGLGSPRTLVLVDGRRLVAARDDGVSDLNVIPPTLI